MTRRALLRLLLSLLLPGIVLAAPSPALAQGGSGQAELEQVAGRFATAWARGNAEAAVGLLSSGGIRLRLEGAERSALPTRQASAVVRDFLKGYDPGEARLVRAAPVAGNPGRGFAEIRWQTRVAGTSHPVAHVVFLGLVREGNGWRVDELRLLP